MQPQSETVCTHTPGGYLGIKTYLAPLLRVGRVHTSTRSLQAQILACVLQVVFSLNVMGLLGWLKPILEISLSLSLLIGGFGGSPDSPASASKFQPGQPREAIHIFRVMFFIQSLNRYNSEGTEYVGGKQYLNLKKEIVISRDQRVTLLIHEMRARSANLNPPSALTKAYICSSYSQPVTSGSFPAAGKIESQ
jgi:hypothetical protein